MAQRHDLVQAISQVFNFRRSNVRVRGLNEGRVERKLTQPRDRRQHAHPVRIHIAQEIEDPRALAGQILVVDMTVFLTQVNAHDVDDLVGQIGCNFLLRTA